VRRDPGQHELTLAQGLPDEVEAHLLEVAQPAVEQLGRPGRRAGRVVPLLDQRDGQPAGHGVQGHASAGHATPDDEHVDVLLGEVPPGSLPVGRIERDRTSHRFPFTSTGVAQL
jgi:hypothetical protein